MVKLAAPVIDEAAAEKEIFMDQQQYLDQLGDALNMLSPEEIMDIQSYYANSIRGDVLNGATEQQAIERLGPPEQVADRVLRTRAQPLPGNVTAPQKKEKHKLGGLAIAGIVIAVCVAVSATGEAVSGLGRHAGASLGHEQYTAVAAEVQSITIDSNADDISIEMSPDNDIHVEWNNRSAETHSVEQSDTALTLTTQAGSGGFNFGMFSFGDDDSEISLQLPRGYEADSLEIKTTSGDISVDDLSAQNSLALKTSSGEIYGYNMNVMGTLQAASTSGDIYLSGGTTGALKVSSTSGYVDVYDYTVSGTVETQTTSGDIDFDNIAVSGASVISSTSGNVELSDFAGKDDLTMNTVSGDIEVGVAGGSDSYKTETETVSGDVDVSLDGSDHTLRMSTVSGDIEAYKE